MLRSFNVSFSVCIFISGPRLNILGADHKKKYYIRNLIYLPPLKFFVILLSSKGMSVGPLSLDT